jgi:hypothetical protein
MLKHLRNNSEIMVINWSYDEWIPVKLVRHYHPNLYLDESQQALLVLVCACRLIFVRKIFNVKQRKKRRRRRSIWMECPVVITIIIIIQHNNKQPSDDSQKTKNSLFLSIVRVLAWKAVWEVQETCVACLIMKNMCASFSFHQITKYICLCSSSFSFFFFFSRWRDNKNRRAKQ